MEGTEEWAAAEAPDTGWRLREWVPGNGPAYPLLENIIPTKELKNLGAFERILGFSF